MALENLGRKHGAHLINLVKLSPLKQTYTGYVSILVYNAFSKLIRRTRSRQYTRPEDRSGYSYTRQTWPLTSYEKTK